MRQRILTLVHKRAEDDGIRRKCMTQPGAVCLCLCCRLQQREKILPEEIELKIPIRSISESVFKLKTCLGRHFHLQESIGNIVLLIAIFSPSVCLKAKPAKAKGSFFVDPGQDAFACIGAILTGEAARLERNPVPREQWVELIEGKRSRASRADEKQIALGKVRLYGSRIQRLKQLRLEQLTDPGDLVPRQNRIGVGKKSMSGIIGWIGIDGLPSLYQRELLESEIAVDTTKAGAARREVRIELQTRSVNRPVVVQLDGSLYVL